MLTNCDVLVKAVTCSFEIVGAIYNSVSVFAFLLTPFFFLFVNIFVFVSQIPMFSTFFCVQTLCLVIKLNLIIIISSIIICPNPFVTKSNKWCLPGHMQFHVVALLTFPTPEHFPPSNSHFLQKRPRQPSPAWQVRPLHFHAPPVVYKNSNTIKLNIATRVILDWVNYTICFLFIL